MSSGSGPSGPPWEGEAVSDDLQRDALRTLAALAMGRYEILGLLGQDREGVFTGLAREQLTDRLVVLKRRPGGELQVLERLDDSVPPPAGSCPVCQTPLGSWKPLCAECGADIGGRDAGDADEAARAQQLAAVREAAQGYEVLGTMTRAEGGGVVYFARELNGGSLVALRLERENAGRRGGYTVAATRMMRPKLLYGTVGGEATREPGRPGGHGWSPVPSLSVPFRSTGLGRGPTSAGAAGDPSSERVCPQCGELFGPELRFCPRDGTALRARAATHELVGDIIAERYHILQKLGEGGMGRVYLAEHVRMGRRCAVKVMHPGLLYDPDSVSRFNREAANASRINHPNVAAIYDFGETEDGIVYLAMELIEGESLASVLARERLLPEARAIAIARQTTDALAAAHDLGIVHRDLKPDNIMLARSRVGHDVVKVVDFGIAKATRGERQDVTRTGYVVGTPAYMSPEQILGESLDGRSDIYSLGCILYETLTGERPFAGPSGEISVRLRLTEAPPRARDVRPTISREFDRLVATAMARSPDQRFPSATGLGEALEAVGRELQSGARWRGWLPWSRRPAGGPTRTAPAAPPTQGTAPVPVGWSQLARPVSAPAGQGQGTGLFHPHPARAEGRRIGLLAGVGLAVVVLPALLYWWLAPSDTERDAPAPAAVVPVPVPEPAAPPPPAQGALRLDPPLPPGTRVSIDGDEVTWSVGQVVSLSPGRYTIGAQAPGHEPASESVEVTVGDTSGLSFTLVRIEEPAAAPPPRAQAQTSRPQPPRPQPQAPRARSTGSIRLEGLPPGAEVTVDGRLLAAGETVATVDPGPRWVRLAAPGFLRDSLLIDVEAGGSHAWRPLLVPSPRRPAEPPPPEPEAEAPRRDAPAPARPPVAREAPAVPEADREAEIRQLLSEYERAINERSIPRLKALYPGLTPERERQWRDLFGEDIENLKATVAVGSIRNLRDIPEASFRLVLSFKPRGAKPQTFRILTQAAISREPGRRQFLSMVERGE